MYFTDLMAFVSWKMRRLWPNVASFEDGGTKESRLPLEAGKDQRINSSLVCPEWYTLCQYLYFSTVISFWCLSN